MKRILLLAVCIALVAATSVQAGSLDSTLTKLAGDAARGYVGPIVSGFGSDLNGGWFHKAPASKMFGFDLEFGLVAMGTTFSTSAKTFATQSSGFQVDNGIAKQLVPLSLIPTTATINGSTQTLSTSQRQSIQSQIISQLTGSTFSVGISGPTIIGSKSDSVKINFSKFSKTFNVTNIDGKQGANASIPLTVPATSAATPVTGILDNVNIVPLAAPQLSLGTFVGTQFTFRYLPSVKINSDIGEFKYFGFGVQHNPGVWFPTPLPVDLSASFFTQTLDVGTIFSTKATAYGINVSKRFGPGALNITPYAGFMLESSKMTFTYDYNAPIPNTTLTTKQHINFELDGENTSRVVVGLSLKLLFLNINADYNIAKYNSFTGGVMFII
ncbi:MAG TPA: DUF6588 family protein [Bacteroidota bacterium]|nr:DUF6588 family protein [Bacteroidota bacterium]